MSLVLPYQKLVKPDLGCEINCDHNFSRGLRGCWLLNERGGVAYNLVNMAVAQGALSGGSAWIGNRVNFPDSSATFANNDNVIDCGTNTSLQLQTFTIRAKCVRAGTATFHAMFALEASVGTPNNAGVAFRFNETSQVIAGIVSVANTFESIVSTDTFTTGVPYDCFMTKDGTSVKIYVNGKQVASGTLSSATVDYTSGVALHTSIGGYFNSATLLFVVGFNGIIEFAHLWNRALSQEEVIECTLDPFANIVQPVRRSYFFVAPAAGGSVPLYYRQRQMQGMAA